MTYSLTFELDGLPKTNPADNRHWRTVQREKQRWQHDAAIQIKRAGAPPEPLQKARAVFTRHSSVQPDGDNLQYSFKYIRDQLIKSGVIQDDSPACLSARYEWEKAPPKKGRVSVRVEG